MRPTILILCFGGWLGCPTPPQTTPTLTASTASTADSGTEPTTDDATSVLVIPNASRLTLLDIDADKVTLSPTWEELMGGCERCGGEGASPDGDGLLVAFTARPSDGIARMNGDGTLDFRVDGFRFPHDVIRDPADGSLMVVETFADRVVWIAGDGSSNQALRSLDTTTEGFAAVPNGAELFPHLGRTYLLLSHLGLRDLNDQATGRITLWDVTVPNSPSLQWSFPEQGGLTTPHGPILRQVDGTWWLLWAHTQGRTGTGTVGVATTADPLVRPTYRVDLSPGDEVAPFSFLRGVERGPSGSMWLVDSGGGRSNGRLIEAGWPTLPAPTGATGGNGDRVYADLGLAAVRRDELPNPFEGWLWTRPQSGDQLER